MTDLTPLLSDILVQSHSGKSLVRPFSLTEKLDGFLKEAYQINSNISSLLSYLRQIRQPYLSTAPRPRRKTTTFQELVPSYLDDSDRDAFETWTSQHLRDLNANISNLSQAASLRASTDTALLERKYGKPNGILQRWAAGEGDTPDAGKSQAQLDDEGKAKTMQIFHEGVLWYLRAQLGHAASWQQDMMQTRINQQRNKDKSVLYKTKPSWASVDVESSSVNGSADGNMDTRGRSFNPALDAERDAAIRAQLTPEQLQLFEEENSTLLNHYNDTLTKVTQAEKSILEISSLQQTLMGHLTTQGEMIEQLVSDAQNTDENVRRGNKELKQATERSSYAKGVFRVTIGLCGFLILWDLVF